MQSLVSSLACRDFACTNLLNQGLHENVDLPVLVYVLQTSLKSPFLPLHVPVITKCSPALIRDAL